MGCTVVAEPHFLLLWSLAEAAFSLLRSSAYEMTRLLTQRLALPLEYLTLAAIEKEEK